MIVLVVVLAGLTGSADSAPAFSDKTAYHAIWADLELNAWIGNGNDIAGSAWFLGTDRDKGPTIHVKDLNCTGTGSARQCRFSLLRAPNPNAIDETDKRQPPLLACRADLGVDAEDGWVVTHRPPPKDGSHSRTTMVCEAAG